MKKYLYPVFFFPVLLLFCSSISLQSQCLLQKTTFGERWQEAELVVEGEVEKQFAFWGKHGGQLYTTNVIKVLKILKGECKAGQVEVVTLGGRMANIKISASPSLSLEKGVKGVFLLKKYRGSRIGEGNEVIWRPVAANAGFLGYSPDLETVRDLFEESAWKREELYQKIIRLPGSVFRETHPLSGPEQNRLAPVISGISPLAVTAGTGTLITITGSGFGSSPGANGTVFFDDADDGAGGSYTGAASDHIQSWSDSQIEVLVPSGAGAGGIFVQDASGAQSPLSSQSLAVSYNLLNVGTAGFPRPRMIDDMCDGDGGYILKYSTNSANNGVDFTAEAGGAAQDAFERAIYTWQNDVGFAFYTGDGCGTTSIQAPDGTDDENVITFDNDFYDLDVEASNSTLGITFSYWSKCGSSEWELEEIDMIYRRNGNPNGFGGSVNWEYGPSLPSAGEIDFETVVLHETGHAHQLGHVIAPGDVMHYAISAGASNRILDVDTRNGANDVEALSLAYNPPFVNCNPPGDFTCSSRDYAVYNTGVACALLPVELLQFEGWLKDNAIELSWKTAVEVSNDHFILERSADGTRFQPIAKVEGAGNRSVPENYLYLDRQPFPGTNYYQLIQVDIDGSRHVLEPIVQVFYPSAQKFVLSPNPASGDQINLFVSSAASRFILIRLYSLQGRLLREEEWTISRETSIYPLSISRLPSGAYFLQITSGPETETLRWVKR
jgi:hypothetical protein